MGNSDRLRSPTLARSRTSEADSCTNGDLQPGMRFVCSARTELHENKGHAREASHQGTAQRQARRDRSPMPGNYKAHVEPHDPGTAISPC